MAKINTVKQAKVSCFGNSNLNQTQCIRTAVYNEWDRDTLLDILAQVYCLAPTKAERMAWAEQRLSLYERYYGTMGVADYKAMSDWTGWSCK